mmetsp:Transcript_56477/g.178687  ORF Transcript_56477/g.178687 Transcript_56477/m.178687 type:complete len:165 (+) Transcript_56477:390-884(+)
MFYGTTVWDPVLIIAQIVCLQSSYYLSLGALLWLLVGGHVPKVTLRFFFDSAQLSVHSVSGWMAILAFLFNSVAGACYLYLLVERAKKCLDFTATLFILHLFCCLCYTGVPSTWEWWLTNILSVTVMAVLGEWLCLRREMREIPVGSLRGKGGMSRTGSRMLNQ